MDARSIEEVGRELGLRRWEEFADAALAFVAGALAVLFGSRAALALALDRDAYVIAAVRRYGCRLTSRRTRARLSRSLRSLVAEPWRCGLCIVPGRVAAFAADLEQLARELEDADSRWSR